MTVNLATLTLSGFLYLYDGDEGLRERAFDDGVLSRPHKQLALLPLGQGANGPMRLWHLGRELVHRQTRKEEYLIFRPQVGRWLHLNGLFWLPVSPTSSFIQIIADEGDEGWR